MSRIFISYRRDDTAPYASHLYENLAARFGDDNLFMDIDTLEPGVDFVEAIENAVGMCDIVLVLIGRQWLSIKDAEGQRRLDNPEDFVRLEVATALERNIRVIPLLVEGAAMPRSTELPELLQKLTRRNAAPLRSADWRSDVGRLITALEKVLASVAAASSAPPFAIKADLQPDANAALVVDLSAQLEQAEAAADWDRVIELGEQILNVDPDHQPTRTKTATAYKQRGLSLRDQHKYDGAIADFSQALSLDPSQIDLRYWRGSCYGRKGELEQGEPDFYRTIADCSEAIRNDPTVADYYYWRGDSYGWLEQENRAMADLYRAVELNPNKPVYYRQRGVRYHKNGDYDRAVEDFSRAIELASDVAEYYRRRGLSYAAKRDYDRAVADYNRAIELDPKADTYYRERGTIYHLKGNYDQAQADHNWAIGLNPNVAAHYFLRGLTYKARGDHNAAKRDFQRAADLGHAEAKQELARI